MIIDQLDVGRFVVHEEPVRIRFETEPFVLVQALGYTVAAKVISTKNKSRGYLLLGAKSICTQLEPIRKDNDDKLMGLEVWIRKAGPERGAPYIIES